KLDPSRRERAHGFPRFLPDGRRFLYMALSSLPENSCSYLATVDGKESRRILNTRWTTDYAPPAGKGEKGHLLFLRDGSLMAQALDPKTFDFAGDAFPIAEGV